MVRISGIKHRLAVALVVGAVAGSMGAPSVVLAEPIKDTLAALLKNHKQIKAAEANARAARENKEVAEGGWFPTFDVGTTLGHESQRKGHETDDTNMKSRSIDLSLTQLVYDFGATDSSIASADLTVRQVDATLDSERQRILADGISAHLGLVSAVEVLGYARESEDNIKKQAELENAKVQRGSGFSTDVLQAKSKLAGAQSLRVEAQGKLQEAVNRYRAVFGVIPEDYEEMDRLATPADMIPETLEDVIKASLEENPSLISTRLAEALARETIVKAHTDGYRPVVNAVAESNHSRNASGTIGNKHENVVKVEMNYSFNLANTALNTLRAAEYSHSSAAATYGYARDIVEEEARNAWSRLLTARETADLRRNQANILGEFLDNARKERAMGRRSLLEVLSSETDLINASSKASEAEMAVVLESYKMLEVMGRLRLEAVR